MIPLADPVRTGDALAAARELLPAWVVWGRTLAPPVVVLLTQLCVSSWAVALLEPRAGPASGAHWTERARRIASIAKPLRILSLCILVPAVLVPGFLPNALDPVPGELGALASLLAMTLGGHLGTRWYFRRVFGWEHSSGKWARFTLSRLLVLRGAAMATFLCLLFVHKDPSTLQLGVLACGTFAILFLELGQGWRLLRALGMAQEFEAAGELAKSSSRVRFFEVELPMATALALPQSRAVLVTRRARQVLEPAGLAAGLYDEIRRRLQSGRVTFVRSLVLPLLLTLAWMRPLTGWIGPKPTVSLLVACVLLVFLAQRMQEARLREALAKSREPTETCRDVVRATERLCAENLVPAVTDDAATRPHLYDKMVAAGLTPDYPRPQPASTGGGWVIITTLVLLAELVALEESTEPKSTPRDERSLLRALAIGGFPEVHLRELASLRDLRGDGRSAEVFRAAAQEIDSQR